MDRRNEPGTEVVRPGDSSSPDFGSGLRGHPRILSTDGRTSVFLCPVSPTTLTSAGHDEECLPELVDSACIPRPKPSSSSPSRQVDALSVRLPKPSQQAEEASRDCMALSHYSLHGAWSFPNPNDLTDFDGRIRPSTRSPCPPRRRQQSRTLRDRRRKNPSRGLSEQ